MERGGTNFNLGTSRNSSLAACRQLPEGILARYRDFDGGHGFVHPKARGERLGAGFSLTCFVTRMRI